MIELPVERSSSCSCQSSSMQVPRHLQRPSPLPAATAAPSLPPTGVGRLILDILHALSQGHDATGHEAQGAVSPSLLLLVR